MLRVLVGNRRLAAIRIINDPELAKKCKISLPEITNEVKESLKSVTVYPVNNEDEARAFIGFKHVNGAHRWDSYAKAIVNSGI